MCPAGEQQMHLYLIIQGKDAVKKFTHLKSLNFVPVFGRSWFWKCAYDYSNIESLLARNGLVGACRIRCESTTPFYYANGNFCLISTLTFFNNKSQILTGWILAEFREFMDNVW